MSTKVPKKKTSKKGEESKLRKKKSHATVDDSKLKSFIKKVLNQVHPDTGITAGAASFVEDLIESVMKRIMASVNILVRQNKKQTISSREVQAAVRMVLPGELAKHAVSEGIKAITKYNTSKAVSPEKTIKKGKSVAVSQSSSFRAGLLFPIARVKGFMKTLSQAERIGSGAPVYLTAVLEYLAAELLELAGNNARDMNKKRISIRSLQLAIYNDEELNRLFKHAVITCGVFPNIHSALLPKKSKKSKKSEY